MAFTHQLGLSNPASGSCNWDDDWWRNQDIKDAALGQVLNGDYVVEGGALSHTAGLTVDITAGSVIINGVNYSVAAGSLPVTGAPGTEEIPNYIYVDSAGTVQVSTVAITEDRFVILGVVNTDPATVTDIFDLRYFPIVSQEPVENEMINGFFDHWQRGNSQGNTGVNSADRIYIDPVQIVSFSFDKVAVGPPSWPFLGGSATFHSRSTFGLPSTTAGYVHVGTKLLDFGRFAGKTIIFSAWMRADTTKNVHLDILQKNPNGSGTTWAITRKNASVSTTWEKKVFVQAIPELNTDIVLGDLNYLQFRIWLTAGSAQNRSEIQDQEGWIDIANIEIYESPLGLELPVRRKTLAEELFNCQYYFQKSYNQGVDPGSAAAGGAVGHHQITTSTILYAGWTPLHRTMLQIPTRTVYSTQTGAAGYVRDTTANAEVPVTSILNANENTFVQYFQFQTSVSAGNRLRYQWKADAEI